MDKRECYCTTEEERVCCFLRDKLQSKGHNCQSLAPWERELYGEDKPVVEPYVNLTVVKADGSTFTFHHVSGIKWESGTLTFEDQNGRLYYVPEAAYFYNDYCDQ